MPDRAPKPMASRGEGGAVALVAAWNEGDRIGDTIHALASLPGVRRVVVADDGSSDDTRFLAAAAGASVVRSERNLGKGAALEAALAWLDRVDDDAPIVLLADGDLGGSAGALGALLELVVAGRADLAVAVPPAPPTGGFGLVRAGASALIRRASGVLARAPLSGQRAVARGCLEACRPLAAGFGVEAAMTADAGRLGFRIVEVDVPVVHRFTGRDAAGFRHRAAQGLDIVRALAPRVVGVR